MIIEDDIKSEENKKVCLSLHMYVYLMFSSSYISSKDSTLKTSVYFIIMADNCITVISFLGLERIL